LNWGLRELILDSRFAHLMGKDEGKDQAEIFRASATCAAGTRATILFAHEKWRAASSVDRLLASWKICGCIQPLSSTSGGNLQVD
jgi:hypothetical protein